MSTGDKKINILLTVDTEAHRGSNPVKDWMYGKFEGKEYGVPLIMDICEQYGIKAIFFIDVPEAWTWGDKIIQEVGNKVFQRGHDLQLHIHSNHITKQPRLFLWEYNYNEQFKIIEESIKKFKEMWGKYPIAFRAGKYGANYNTLDILSDLGIKMDFSMFYNQKWCGLNNPPLTINNPKKYKNVIEVPVTIFKSFDILGIKRFDAISIDDVPFLEFKKVFEEIMKRERPRVITLMLHSFSFIKRDKNGNLKEVNKRAIARTKKILEILSQQNNISFITASELWQKIKEDNLSNENGDNFIPEVRNKFFQYFFTIRRAWSIFGKNKKATFFILLNIGGLIILWVLLASFIKSIF